MKKLKLNRSSLGGVISFITELVLSDKTYQVNVSEWRECRSLSQNSLYWKWMAEIDKQAPLIIEGTKVAGSELWHEVFKKYYCTVKKATNGIKFMKITSTKMLDVGEMTFYLNRIEQFCIERGIMLTIPESSEYYKLMESQTR